MSDKAARQYAVENFKNKLAAPSAMTILGDYILSSLTAGNNKERLWAAKTIYNVVFQSPKNDLPVHLRALINSIEEALK